MGASADRVSVLPKAWDDPPAGGPGTALHAGRVVLGPIGHMAYPKDQPNCFNPHPILRREYDLVSNIRPAKSYAEIPCINPNVDLVIIRENNEGFQPDRNMFRGTSDCMPTPDMALSLRVITRRNSTLVAREGFELARRRGGRKKVTAVHKNTVFKLGCGLFIEACGMWRRNTRTSSLRRWWWTPSR